MSPIVSLLPPASATMSSNQRPSATASKETSAVTRSQTSKATSSSILKQVGRWPVEPSTTQAHTKRQRQARGLSMLMRWADYRSRQTDTPPQVAKESSGAGQSQSGVTDTDAEETYRDMIDYVVVAKGGEESSGDEDT